MYPEDILRTYNAIFFQPATLNSTNVVLKHGGMAIVKQHIFFVICHVLFLTSRATETLKIFP